MNNEIGYDALGQEAMAPPVIDPAVLRVVWQRRWRLFLVIGTLFWAGVLVFLHKTTPRRYSSNVSIVMQSSTTGGAGGVASMLLGGGGAKNYQGIITSRAFAEGGVEEAGILDLYHFPVETEAEAFGAAVQMVQQGVNLEDRRDGLLYLTVSLPDRVSPMETLDKDRVKETTQRLANVYVGRFRRYLATSNSDRDTYLIRKGQDEVDKAWYDYQRAVAALSRFVGTRSVGVAPTAPSAGGGAGTGATGATGPRSSGAATAAAASTASRELEQLYLSRAQVEAEIQAAEAARATTSGLASGDETRLPSEDPLLADARRRVREARLQLDNLRIELADTNPEVIAARERLRLAESQLQRESRSVQRGQTSDVVQLSALRAKYATINGQIAGAEARFRADKSASADLLRLQNEMMIRLDILRAASSQYATMKIQTVAGDSLMTIIDKAQLPGKGQPGLLTMGIKALLVTLFVLALWAAFEYRRTIRLETLRSTGF